jgi:hypothetical protein
MMHDTREAIVSPEERRSSWTGRNSPQRHKVFYVLYFLCASVVKKPLARGAIPFLYADRYFRPAGGLGAGVGGASALAAAA